MADTSQILIGLLRETVNECIEDEELQNLKQVDSSKAASSIESNGTSMEDVPGESSPVKVNVQTRTMVLDIVNNLIDNIVISSEAQNLV